MTDNPKDDELMAGWYPDKSDRDNERFWNGSGWTELTRRAAAVQSDDNAPSARAVTRRTGHSHQAPISWNLGITIVLTLVLLSVAFLVILKLISGDRHEVEELSGNKTVSVEENDHQMDFDRLVTAINSGEDCPELFLAFDQMDEDSVHFAPAQEEMRRVGCFLRSSTRSDLNGGNPQAGASPWHGVAGERVTPSALCLSTAEAASNEPDFYYADVVIEETLQACVTVNEWISALEAHHGVISGTLPDSTTLESAC